MEHHLSKTEQVPPKLLAVGPDEAARITAHSRSGIYKAIAAGELRSFKSGKRRMILVRELEIWINRVAREKAIVFLADNLGLLALTGASAAIGALTGKSLLAAQGALTHAAAMIQQRSEAIGVARATFTVADSQVIYTKAQLAAAQASVAATTGMKRLSLVQSELIPRQIAATAAINAQAVAQNNLNKSMALTSGRALLGLLGGPAGMATLAVAASASWMLFSDSTSHATDGLIDMKAPLDEIIAKFKTLTAVQQENLRIDVASKMGNAQKETKTSFGSLSAKAELQVSQFTGNEFSPTYVSPENKIALDQFLVSLDRLKGSSVPAAELSAGFKNLVYQFAAATGASDKQRDALFGLVKSAEDAKTAQQLLEQQQSALNQSMINTSISANQLGKELATGAPSDKTIESWKKYNERLAERLAKAKDPSNLGEVNRGIAADKVDQYAPEVAAERRRLAALIDASDVAKKAQDDARQSAKQRADEADRQARQIQDNYDRTLKTLNEQADVHSRKTELAKIEFETTKGTLTKLDAAKKVDLERAAIAVDHLNSQKSYAELLSDVQKGEDALLVTTRKRYQELARIKEQGGLTADQYAAGANAISKGSVEEAPKFAGLDASVGGASGELIKVAEADKELAKWHEKELARQKDLHDAKLTNEQQYLDRVRDINQQNTDQLKTMQSAYTSATLGIFSGMTGNVADMMGDMAGKSSAAYKIMFAASKASAIAQAIVNTQEASTKALTMGPIFGIPAASLITGLGYASIGIMAATAVAGFSEGGYTGPGGKLEPKGVVHGGEVVIRKAVVDQPGMKDYLIGLNARGYASGGFVGNPVATPSFKAPQVSASGLGAPQINISIKSDGSGGTVESTEGLQALGEAVLAKVGEELTAMRQDIPKIVRAGIIQEKGQNGLLDPSNRRNT